METFILIEFALFYYIIVINIGQFIENENSPVLTVPATIVDMRRKTHRHHSNGHHHDTHSYQVTFEMESGVVLLLPVIMIAIVAGIQKACI